MFSTVIDVTNALAPSDDTVGSAATIPTDQITDAILEADARIAAYLPSTYTVPTVVIQQPPPNNVTVAHPLFRFLSRDIAAYLASLTYYKNKDLLVDDAIRLRFAWATDLLNQIKNGELFLPGDTGDDSTLSVWNQYEGRLFSLEDFDLATVPAGLSYYDMMTLGMWR